MRLTSIDIGTNTILMLVADSTREAPLKVVRDEHSIARLGKGVDANGIILPDTFERVLKTLQEYKRISEEYKSEKIIACGTSALRDARNREKFIAFIFKRLGFEIRVLSGNDEAELTYRGAVHDFLEEGQEQNFAVLDIGGGSTELTIGHNEKVDSRSSVDVGSVRSTERFLKQSPPNSLGVGQSLSHIRSQIAEMRPLSSTTKFIGVAGTLTTLAAIDLQLPSFDRERVNGHVLTYDAVYSIFNRLRIKTLEELTSIPQILPERADILLGGILILLEILKQLGVEKITVSDKGLRFGVLLKEFGQVGA